MMKKVENFEISSSTKEELSENDIEVDLFVFIANLLSEQFGVNRIAINLNSNFYNDWDFDSLDMVEACMLINENFGEAIPDEEIWKIQTLKELLLKIKQGGRKFLVPHEFKIWGETEIKNAEKS